MKLLFVVAVSYAAIVAFHPGVFVAEPRIASSGDTEIASTADYTIELDHSSISFEVKHLGLNSVHGRLNQFSGKIHEDQANLNKSSVEFTAEADSIDTAIAARDKNLKGGAIFDAANFPKITFKSVSVSKRRGGYSVTGDLTIKGKTKRITIPFKHYGPLKMTVGDMKTRVGIVADPVVIKRSDFGVGNQMRFPDGTIPVSDEVTVRISLEATLD